MSSQLPSFDVRTWRRLLRDGLFDEADSYLGHALTAGGPASVDEVARAYDALSVDHRWCLLAGMPTEVPAASRAPLSQFLTKVLEDPSSPQAHQAEALHALGDLGVPGSEELIVRDLRSRSAERRSMAIAWLAAHGGPLSVEPVRDRIRVLLRRPAQSGGGRDFRPSAEVLHGVLLMLRCASPEELNRLRSMLLAGQANLSGVERSWLRHFWPACLDSTADDLQPPSMERVRAWARGEQRVTWPGWVDVPPELDPKPEDGWDLDPPPER